MNRVLWFAAGIGVGALAAHQFNQTAQGKKFFTELDEKVKDFSDALVDGYHERETELRSVVGETENSVTKADR